MERVCVGAQVQNAKERGVNVVEFINIVPRGIFEGDARMKT